MLATLKRSYIFDIPTGQNRLFSLVRVPPLGMNLFADGGQGPEKPIIIEEAEAEEEIFTFPYPEERGEISDIVNPPVEGIAGKVLRTTGKITEKPINTRDFLNVFPYIFFDSGVERPTRMVEPEFVSFTKQSEIAGSYAGLLVYSGYAISNANFSYISNKSYQSPSFTEKEIFYESNKPIYENKVPMPMVSGRVHYQPKERDNVYVTPLVQPELQIYQKTADIELPDLHVNINEIVVPKYNEVKVIKYEAVKDAVNLPANLGFDDTLLRDKFIEKLNLQVIESGQQDIKLPAEVKAVEVRVLTESYGNIHLQNSNSQPIEYKMAMVSSDPYSLFNLHSAETGANYKNNLEVRTILLPNTEYKARINLDNIVRVNYDAGGQLSLRNTPATNYNLDLAGIKLNLDAGTALVDTSNNEGVSSGRDLEQAVEQERELTEEKPGESIEAEVYDDSAAKEGVYENTDVNEEQEVKTDESEESSAGYLAAVTGAVGVGVLAGAAGLLGALFNKENDKSPDNKSDESLHKSEEGKTKKKCGDSSQCFADTIKWVEGKLENPSLSDKEYESISQCYAEDIKNIQKARDYIKQREINKPSGNAFYERFHHVGFTDEQNKKYQLKDYARKGETQQGFKLVTAINVGADLEGDYFIDGIWEDDLRGGESEKVTLRKNSAYVQLDIGLREQGYTPVWKIMSYIDTDTGEKRSGLYLETIAETHLEAKELLGDKDDYGMKLMGAILLINGIEPGEGTISMHDYNVKPGDKLEVVFKNDSARYDNNQQITNRQIKADSANYPGTKKSNEKTLEPQIV